MTVFLDLDGTLVEVSRKYYAVYRDILKRHGYNTLGIQSYWEMKRDGTSNRKILLHSNCGLSEEDYKIEFTELIEKNGYLRFDVLKAGARSTLEQLSGFGELVLVTMRKNRDALLKELEQLRIIDFFIKVVNDDLGDDTKAWEKKEKLFKEHIVGKQAFVIGDSEAEIKAGKNLGYKTIAVSNGIRTVQILRGLEPDYILSDIHLVADTMKDLGISKKVNHKGLKDER